VLITVGPTAPFGGLQMRRISWIKD